ncbi:MAG: hypothetical protein SGBAC_013130 [Bacillariaceae sp.]
MAEGDGTTVYVMVASGMDATMVRKVPQLHLARMHVKDQTLCNAKVVNRALGTAADVCGPLVDAALTDVGKIEASASSTLHGICQWVRMGLNGSESIESLKEMQQQERHAIEAIASGKSVPDDVYTKGKYGWEKLIDEYVAKGLGEEAALYQAKGGKFVGVDHNADTTAYAEEGAGSIARFTFE